MRLFIILALALLWSSRVSAGDVDSIEPGMPLNEVKAALVRHGYGVGPKHGGAYASDRKNIALEFCTIDARTTLIISYEKTSKQVISLDVYFYPAKRLPKSERQEVQRKARKILFDEEGTFTVSLERVVDQKKTQKGTSAVNPFE
jgi:hypothetical protein